MNEIYFAKNDGSNEVKISSAAAQEIMQRCNEKAKDIKLGLSKISFINTYINIIGASGSEQLSKVGLSEDQIKELKGKALLEARYIALSAWFRRAIAEKDKEGERLDATTYGSWEMSQRALGNYKEEFNLIDKVNELILNMPTKVEYKNKRLEELGIVAPEEPFKGALITAPSGDDIDPKDGNADWEVYRMEGFKINDMASFLLASATSAVIGDMIHQDSSPLKSAKDTYYEKVGEPRETSGQGKDLMVLHYEPSVNSEVVDNVFDEFHASHREHQRITNSWRFKAKSQIEASNLKVESDYQAELKEYKIAKSKYDAKVQEIFREYDKIKEDIDNQKVEKTVTEQLLESEFNNWKTSEKSRVGSLKITVPNSFKDLYDQVSDDSDKK